MRGLRMTTLTRYVLLQIPGWAVAAGVLYLVWPATGLAVWLGVATFAGWVLKDFILFPLVRIGYEPGAKTGVEQLVGMCGVVSRSVDPHGWVRLRGERWRATLAPGEAAAPAGATVKVTRVTGLTLVVARVGESGDPSRADRSQVSF
jgi:membrane protein implicated in regulation of membrane protease activity